MRVARKVVRVEEGGLQEYTTVWIKKKMGISDGRAFEIWKYFRAIRTQLLDTKSAKRLEERGSLGRAGLA